ncbi:MAG: hypothetical protein OEZ59_13790 [Deltaproteobacteria bacterium]|nr:hypothetical protein [Deltaproteobacteria bacterium]
MENKTRNTPTGIAYSRRAIRSRITPGPGTLLRTMLLTLLLALLVPMPSHWQAAAEQPGKPPPRPALPAVVPLPEGVKEGREVSSGGQTYRLLPGVRAVSQGMAGKTPDAGTPPEKVLEKMGARARSVLAMRGPFIIYHDESAEQDAATATTLDSGTPSLPVVRNSRTGDLGVLTGALAVRLVKGVDPEQLAEDYDLIMGAWFKRLDVVMLHGRPGNDLFLAAVRLTHDSRVVRADVEIQERSYTPY